MKLAFHSACVSFFLLAGACPQALAQAWPVRPVRIVVPFSPGGTADTLGRLVAAKLSETFGQGFVTDNRPGAGGFVGLDVVARAAPDGYTLGVSGIGPLVVAPAQAAKPTYDPLKDFTHIALFGGPPSALAVNPSLPATTLHEFIELAKAKPGSISYGSAGTGSTGQLLAEIFRQMAGIEMVHVPYKGASGAVFDLVAGNIQAISTTVTTAKGQIRAGKIRVLAISSAERLPDYQEAPTFRELGYPQLTASVWFSLSGPAGMPKPIVDRLNAEVQRVLQLPEIRARLRDEDIEPGSLDAGAFSRFVADELKRWTPVVRSSMPRSG
jgi:tripartite-type tricarboxylate transporter receptor subunit TctC